MDSLQPESSSQPGVTTAQANLSPNGEVALSLARAGIPVFPCAAEGKKRKQPLVLKGHHAASTDLKTVHDWWKQWPTALVGVPTGPGSGLWVLDVDGEEGLRSLRELLLHLQIASLADLTPCVSRTPSGGLHLIFRLQSGERPRNRAKDIGPGLDTRGVKQDGSSAGYFIAPGSRLPDGTGYELIDPASFDVMGGPQ
jgi:hypothetical protein